MPVLLPYLIYPPPCPTHGIKFLITRTKENTLDNPVDDGTLISFKICPPPFFPLPSLQSRPRRRILPWSPKGLYPPLLPSLPILLWFRLNHFMPLIITFQRFIPSILGQNPSILVWPVGGLHNLTSCYHHLNFPPPVREVSFSCSEKPSVSLCDFLCLRFPLS